MDFLHKREYLDTNQYVKVDCDTQCNVHLTDDNNFAAFQRGDSHRYYGGFFRQLPAVLVPPHAGYWNIVLDLGGDEADIKYSFTVGTIPND